MNALIVHNSDEVKACFIGTEKEILAKLKESEYWEDITDRCNNLKDLDDPGEEEEITIDDVTDLYHDGDSEDGYTLIEVI